MNRHAMNQAFKILIYCDHPSHARRVPVDSFLALPNGGWHEQPPSRASTGSVGSGHHLIGDELGAPGWANDPNVSSADVRDRFKLVCRKCKGTGGQGAVDVRAEKLFELLDGWRNAGVLEVPLAVVAASLSSRSGD